MRSILKPARPGSVAPTQMVWLPGAYHSAQDFVDQGFSEAVLRRQIPLDLRFVDLEMQHLDDREPLDRLRAEIVLPARGSGVSVWLAGISLGGAIALEFAGSYPDELDGLCLLAPYLGNRGELAEGDVERRICRYLEARADSRPLYLGYGQEDRFSAAHSVLAGKLPADAVDVIAGGHEWRTWTKLWENFLDSRFT
jgi:pimeloyl-ACP methyl ester carboxylesterase